MEPDLVPYILEFDHYRLEMSGGGIMVAGPRSVHWEKTRHDFAVLHPTCAACGGSKLIQIHHCLPFHLRPDLELDFGNLITLCEDPSRWCHYRIGHAWDWKAYNPFCRTDAAEQLQRVARRLYEVAA